MILSHINSDICCITVTLHVNCNIIMFSSAQRGSLTPTLLSLPSQFRSLFPPLTSARALLRSSLSYTHTQTHTKSTYSVWLFLSSLKSRFEAVAPESIGAQMNSFYQSPAIICRLISNRVQREKGLHPITHLHSHTQSDAQTWGTHTHTSTQMGIMRRAYTVNPST